MVNLGENSAQDLHNRQIDQISSPALKSAQLVAGRPRQAYTSMRRFLRPYLSTFEHIIGNTESGISDMQLVAKIDGTKSFWPNSNVNSASMRNLEATALKWSRYSNIGTRHEIRQIWMRANTHRILQYLCVVIPEATPFYGNCRRWNLRSNDWSRLWRSWREDSEVLLRALNPHRPHCPLCQGKFEQSTPLQPTR